MPALDCTEVSLIFFGDDLTPKEISTLLGQQPTQSETKGDVRVGNVSVQKWLAETGGWHLIVPTQSDGDFDA